LRPLCRPARNPKRLQSPLGPLPQSRPSGHGKSQSPAGQGSAKARGSLATRRPPRTRLARAPGVSCGASRHLPRPRPPAMSGLPAGRFQPFRPGPAEAVCPAPQPGSPRPRIGISIPPEGSRGHLGASLRRGMARPSPLPEALCRTAVYGIPDHDDRAKRAAGIYTTAPGRRIMHTSYAPGAAAPHTRGVEVAALPLASREALGGSRTRAITAPRRGIMGRRSPRTTRDMVSKQHEPTPLCQGLNMRDGAPRCRKDMAAPGLGTLRRLAGAPGRTRLGKGLPWQETGRPCNIAARQTPGLQSALAQRDPGRRRQAKPASAHAKFPTKHNPYLSQFNSLTKTQAAPVT